MSLERLNLRAFLLILVAACACLPPIVVGLGKSPPNRGTMEYIQHGASYETWVRQHAEGGSAWVIPFSDGEARYQKPPVTVWLNLIAWTGLEPETADEATLIHRARLVSAFLGFLMIVATGLLAHSFRGAWAGLSGAIACGTILIVQSEARLASYDIHLAAFGTVAIALLLIAAKTPSRRHWLALAIGSGAACGFAWLSKGPLAILVLATGVAGLIAAFPAQWKRVSLAGLISFITGCAVALPWYAILLTKYPEVRPYIFGEYSANLSTDHSMLFYPIRLIAGTFPWTPWWLLGLIAPFFWKRARQSSGLRFAWVWGVLFLLALLFHSGKATRYLVPAAPALAILVVEMFAMLDEARDSDRSRRIAMFLRGAHWVMLLFSSLAIGASFASPTPFAGFSFPSFVTFHTLGRPGGMALSGALLMIAFIGITRLKKNESHALGDVALTGFWVIIMTFAIWLSTVLT